MIDDDDDDDDDDDNDDDDVSVSNVDAADKLSECPDSCVRRLRRPSLKYDQLPVISVATELLSNQSSQGFRHR